MEWLKSFWEGQSNNDLEKEQSNREETMESTQNNFANSQLNDINSKTIETQNNNAHIKNNDNDNNNNNNNDNDMEQGDNKYYSISDDNDSNEMNLKRHQKYYPKILRNHPRWAPTNEKKDINCLYFIIPDPRSNNTMSFEYNWMTDRMSIDRNTDKAMLQYFKLYEGSFLNCIRLKYLFRHSKTYEILNESFGSDEPYNTYFYETNHIFHFRKRPPGFLFFFFLVCFTSHFLFFFF